MRAFTTHPEGDEDRDRPTARNRRYALFTAGGQCLARRVSVASTFLSRFVGLLARRRLEDDEGLLLCPGGTVHTFGMRFAIDVIFLDPTLQVKAFCRRVPPWRIALAPPGTAVVAELPAGRIETIKLDATERLVLRSLRCNAAGESPLQRRVIAATASNGASLQEVATLPSAREPNPRFPRVKKENPP